MAPWSWPSRDSVQAPCMKSRQILSAYVSPVGNLIARECNCYSLGVVGLQQI